MSVLPGLFGRPSPDLPPILLSSRPQNSPNVASPATLTQLPSVRPHALLARGDSVSQSTRSAPSPRTAHRPAKTATVEIESSRELLGRLASRVAHMANHELPEGVAEKVRFEAIGRAQARSVGALVSRLLP